jgi:hypothetical protein
VTWDPDSRSALKKPSVPEETSIADAAIASTGGDINTLEESIASTFDGLSTLEKHLSRKEERKRIAKEMRKTLTLEKDSTRREMANLRRYLGVMFPHTMSSILKCRRCELEGRYQHTLRW